MSVFSPNIGKYGPELTPYLNTFHEVLLLSNVPYALNNSLELKK